VISYCTYIVLHLLAYFAVIKFLVRPEAIACEANLSFDAVFLFFPPRVIFELRRPIGAKFCTMLGAAFNFIISVQNFEGAFQRNI